MNPPGDSYTFQFQNITRETFRHLAEEHNFNCISIYINTVVNDGKPDAERAYTSLNRQCDELEKELIIRNVQTDIIKSIQRYLNRILVDKEFWNNLSRLISIFVNKDGIHYFTLPVKGKTLIYYSDHFYLKPVLPHLKEYESYFVDQKIDELKNKLSSNAVSVEIEKILPASASGNIDTLFINEKKDVFGLYDHENRTVIVDENFNRKNESLVNTALVNALLKGAKIISLSPEEMPVQGAIMNAVLKTNHYENI